MLLCITVLDAQRRQTPAASLDLIVLDVVVTDREGAPISDLDLGDFRIKQDGQVVEPKTFSRVDAARDDRPDAGRTVAILLDDTGVHQLGTEAVQRLGRAVLSLARPRDEVSVVRLHGRDDEAYGDMIEALARLDAYRAGVRPFNLVETQITALNRVAAMSRQLSITEGRRKALVCIGAQLVCDVPAPTGTTRRQLSDAWMAAVSAAAVANVAVYAIVPGRMWQRGGGIAEATGGLTYAGVSDFREPILTLWRDSSAHYLIGYWPGARSRQLHSIDVSVARPKIKVRARRQR